MTPEQAEAFAENGHDAVWRICDSGMYKIMIKDVAGTPSGTVPFRANDTQRRFMTSMHYRNVILKARQLGMCLDPSTRVLTAGLRWVPIGELEAGDEVISVDEHPAPMPGRKARTRRMRTGVVEAAVKVFREAYRITFDDGRSVVCTDQHPWLTRNTQSQPKWRSLSGKGNEVVGKIRVGTYVRWVTKPWDEPTVEDGWFAGMLDGEGSFSINGSPSVNVSQRPGPVWERLLRYVKDRGYNYCIESDGGARPSKFGTTPVPKIAFGRMDELFRLMGQCRPTRFIDRRWWEGAGLPGKKTGIGWAEVVSIEPLGEQTLIDLQTTTGTYIAEGFVSHNTTLVCLMWLDYALFNRNVRCGIVAQDDASATAFFRDKVKFAYDNLDPELKKMFPLRSSNTNELLFAHAGVNGEQEDSGIRVATSFASATLHRLLISEYAKICAKFPERANEVVIGTMPTVPENGVIIIESTGEGAEGDYYDRVKKAEKLDQEGRTLNAKDFRLHFYPWFIDSQYEMEPAGVLITPELLRYFADVEKEMGVTLTPRKRAWYAATLEGTFSGNQEEKMFSQYPSTAAEPFFVSTEGNYLRKEMAIARKQGRVCRIPVMDSPVNVFADLGNSDGCALWYHQPIGMEDRFIRYYEAHGEKLSVYAKEIRDTGFIINKIFLPHDADHKRLSDTNKSIKEMLEDLLPGVQFEIVPKVTDLNAGIQTLRAEMASAYLDVESCKQGIDRLDRYTKRWSTRDGRYIDEPNKSNGCSEAADALRQWAQAKMAGNVTMAGATRQGRGLTREAPDWRL